MSSTGKRNAIQKGERIILLKGNFRGEYGVVTSVFEVNGFERYYIRLDSSPVEMYCDSSMLIPLVSLSDKYEKFFWYRRRPGHDMPYDFVALLDSQFLALETKAEDKETDRYGLTYLGHLTREAFTKSGYFLKEKHSNREEFNHETD